MDQQTQIEKNIADLEKLKGGLRWIIANYYPSVQKNNYFDLLWNIYLTKQCENPPNMLIFYMLKFLSDKGWCIARIRYASPDIRTVR